MTCLFRARLFVALFGVGITSAAQAESQLRCHLLNQFTISCDVLADNVIISGIVVNRGRCNHWDIDKAVGKQLHFGDSFRVENLPPSCNAIEYRFTVNGENLTISVPTGSSEQSGVPPQSGALPPGANTLPTFQDPTPPSLQPCDSPPCPALPSEQDCPGGSCSGQGPVEGGHAVPPPRNPPRTP